MCILNSANNLRKSGGFWKGICNNTENESANNLKCYTLLTLNCTNVRYITVIQGEYVHSALLHSKTASELGGKGLPYKNDGVLEVNFEKNP